MKHTVKYNLNTALFTSVVLIGLCCKAKSQNRFLDNLNYNLSPGFGLIVPHKPIINAIVKDNNYSLEFNIYKKTNGTQLWHKLLNYPNVGLSAQFINYGYNAVLGNCISLAPFIQFNTNKKIFLPSIKLAWGVCIVTKPYDAVSNPDNFVIGSYLNTFVLFKTSWHLPITNAIDIEPGIIFAHASNGRFQTPNLGLNVLLFNLGVSLKPSTQNLNATSINTASIWPTKHELYTWAAFGINELPQPGGIKYNAHTISFNYYYNQSELQKWGLGLDLFYDQINAAHLKLPINNFNSNLLQVGIKGCYAFNIGRLSLPIEMGAYLISNIPQDGHFFHRIGMRYYFKNGIVASFTLRSEWAIATHFDYGIGYRFSFIN